MFQCALCILIFLIVHKNNIKQTDDHQFACELFEAAPMIQTKKGAQQYSNHSIQVHVNFKPLKKVHKALKIILLQFLTLPCRLVTKGHTHFNKSAAESCRFVEVCMTFWYHLECKQVNKEKRYASKSKSKSLKNMIFWN